MATVLLSISTNTFCGIWWASTLAFFISWHFHNILSLKFHWIFINNVQFHGYHPIKYGYFINFHTLSRDKILVVIDIAQLKSENNSRLPGIAYLSSWKVCPIQNFRAVLTRGALSREFMEKAWQINIINNCFCAYYCIFFRAACSNSAS